MKTQRLSNLFSISVMNGLINAVFPSFVGLLLRVFSPHRRDHVKEFSPNHEFLQKGRFSNRIKWQNCFWLHPLIVIILFPHTAIFLYSQGLISKFRIEPIFLAIEVKIIVLAGVEFICYFSQIEATKFKRSGMSNDHLVYAL